MNRIAVLLSLMLLILSLAGFSAQASISVPDEVLENLKESIDEAREDFTSRRNLVEAALANPDFTTPEAESLFNEAVTLAENGDYAEAMTKLDASMEQIESRKMSVKIYWTMIAYLICYLCFFGFVGWVWLRSRGLEAKLRA